MRRQYAGVTARHVVGALMIALLRALGATSNLASHVFRQLTNAITKLYDVYIAVPLRIEAAVNRGRHDDDSAAASPRNATPRTRKSLA